MECNGVINDIGSIMWQWCTCHWHQLTKKPSCTSFQLSWPKKYSGAIDNTINITWCQDWCKWCHVTRNSCCTSFWSSWHKKCSGTIDGAVHITWCWHQCSGITWHQCHRHNVDVSGITWKKQSCCMSFQLSWCKECIGDINKAVGLMWCWWQCQWHQMASKKSCYTPFQLPLPKDCNDAIFNTIGNLWWWWQCQYYTSFWFLW